MVVSLMSLWSSIWFIVDAAVELILIEVCGRIFTGFLFNGLVTVDVVTEGDGVTISADCSSRFPWASSVKHLFINILLRKMC